MRNKALKELFAKLFIVLLAVFSFAMGRASGERSADRVRSNDRSKDAIIWKYQKKADKYQFLFEQCCKFGCVNPERFEQSWTYIINADVDNYSKEYYLFNN